MNYKNIKTLYSIANELDSKGLFKEATELDRIVKSASLNVGRFKRLLREVLEKDNVSIRDGDLNPNSNRWGNINSYFKQFLLNAGAKESEAAAASSDWASNAKFWGPNVNGYRPTLEGMLDLLEDYLRGGRARIGIALDGSGLRKNISSEQKEQMRGERILNELTDPLKENDPRAQRAEAFENLRRNIPRLQNPKKQDEVERLLNQLVDQTDLPMDNLPPEVPQAAMMDPIYELGNWEQLRGPSGEVKGYREKGSTKWLTQMADETINEGGRMVQRRIGPNQSNFYLATGGREELVGNIGHPATNPKWNLKGE